VASAGLEEGEVIAYVLIVAEVGREHEVKERVVSLARELNVRAEAHVVYGEYDVVVRVEAPSLRKVDRVVSAIRATPGVLRTITLIAAE